MTMQFSSLPSAHGSPQHETPTVAPSVAALAEVSRNVRLVSGNVLLAEQPIKIWVLGEFRVAINGVDVPASKNMPRIPWLLLKCLVAHGSRAVKQERLAELLWPDSEGDAAYRSLITTVFRLRRLLGCKDAVRFQNRSLSLDAALCCVDAWQFECAIADPQNLEQVRQGLTLYRGAFLGGDCDQDFEITAREHLQRKYLRAVLAYGDHLVRKCMLDAAVACYEAAIEVEPDSLVLRERCRELQSRRGRSDRSASCAWRPESMTSNHDGKRTSAATNDAMTVRRAAIGS